MLVQSSKTDTQKKDQNQYDVQRYFLNINYFIEAEIKQTF